MLQPIDPTPADGFALVAYDWKDAGTKQLVYSGRDGHIHELSAGVAGLWRHTDLTKVTGAPPADNSLLAAYAWEGGNTKQVVYTGSDGNVYELVFRQDSRWSFTDLTSLTGAPLAVGSALAAFAWDTGLSIQVVYIDRNHHLIELHKPLQETWKHTDLTQLLGLPESSQDVLAAHEWTPEFAQHIVYLDTAENPHIHSLMLKHGEDWRHEDVTSLTGSQPIV